MGIKERRIREKKIRKELILKAAKNVFFEHGFDGTSMDLIAREVELSKGTLYLYFKSKDSLYLSLLVEGMDILTDTFTNVLDETTTGWEEGLRALGKAYYRYSVEYEQFFHINFRFQHGELKVDESDALYAKCFDKGYKCLGFLSKCIQEGIDAGDVKKQDPMEIAVMLWGSLTGIILLHGRRRHKKFMPDSIDSLMEKSIDILVEGVKHCKEKI